MVKKRTKEIYNYLIANDEKIPLEHRLLLGSLLMGIFMGLAGTLVNLLLTASLIASIIPFILVILTIILYYFARVKKIYKPISIITSIGGILGISIVWVFNGGINGPNFMIALTFLILGLIIVPDNTKYYVIIIFIFTNVFILLIQLYRPDLIVNYQTELFRWVDNLLGIIISSFFLFLIVRFIHKYYNNEKLRAEESERLKSAFLANMSHEIRTPMNGILGFAELIKEPELTFEQQKIYIGIIEKSGIRMLNIINNIVDISKIEAGLMLVNLQESNINEQMEYIYNFFKPEIEAKGMVIYYKNPLPAKEATTITDREKLFAILTNLVKNAIKYTDEGHIEIGCKAVNIEHKMFLQFYVKDTGIGIAKGRRKAIFERFIQADISDKMARQGAGLGLAVSKAYINMLNGKMWLESEEGIGSTFYFTIPYHIEAKEKANVKNVNSNSGNENKVDVENLGLKVLIAEDDEISDMYIRATVKSISQKIFVAETGVEAVEICKNNPDIDLILMDIKMPDMNGYEATQQIRKFNNDVVIIAQTAYGLTGDKDKSLKAGCNDYISKPLNKTELLTLIQKHFKKNRIK